MHIRRLLRRAGFERSPLRRRADRVESVAALVAVLLVIAMLPVALVIGSAARASGLAESTAERSARHPVTATLLASVPDLVGDTNVGTQLATPATWRTPNGIAHTGSVPAWPGSAAGQRIQIWLDDRGAPANPPLTADQAYWRGVMSALLVMLGFVACCAFALAGLRWWNDRRRYARWDQEWRLVGPLWTKHRS